MRCEGSCWRAPSAEGLSLIESKAGGICGWPACSTIPRGAAADPASLRDADICVGDDLSPAIDIGANKVPEIGLRSLRGRRCYGSKPLKLSDRLLVGHRLGIGSVDLRHVIVGQSLGREKCRPSVSLESFQAAFLGCRDVW